MRTLIRFNDTTYEVEVLEETEDALLVEYIETEQREWEEWEHEWISRHDWNRYIKCQKEFETAVKAFDQAFKRLRYHLTVKELQERLSQVADPENTIVELAISGQTYPLVTTSEIHTGQWSI
ncbi:hypothetical protein SDC9_15026 [bioreactor metagenome]|uniref:Uncharacterized protein n=1 Tax=bioreactor metagenome TaxID=1076179 RepID=A0A644TRM5_9ZZZZ